MARPLFSAVHPTWDDSGSHNAGLPRPTAARASSVRKTPPSQSGEQHLIRLAVVVWMKRQRMLIGVYEAI